MNLFEISDLLTCPERRLRAYDDALLFGPAGDRLCVDCLLPKPGFAGAIDFIHKQNIPLLFSLEAEGISIENPSYIWKPDEGVLSFENESMRFFERKLITSNDIAISISEWQNKTDAPIRLKLLLPEGFELNKANSIGCSAHGITAYMRVAGSLNIDKNTLILPSETLRVCVAAALGLENEVDLLEDRLNSIWLDDDFDEAFSSLRQACLSWFSRAPRFECSDKLLTKCWYYRLYILKNTMAKPACGNLPDVCYYEGRDHRMSKDAFSPRGWEFSRLIPLSTPLQAMDLRWIDAGKPAVQALKALSGCMDNEGIFAVTSVDSIQKQYANFAGWSLYQAYLISGDTDFVRKLLPAFKQDALNVYEKHAEGGCLQIERTHALTGKEYQPSFWYFGEDRYPMEVRPAAKGYTPLKRVDRSVYMYLNLSGLSRLAKIVGDADSDKLYALAENLRREILEKMWDDDSGFFYDLHYLTEAPALVKNIVGFYPFWADITSKNHMRALDYLFSPECFALGSGFASVAKDCPVFSPNGEWRGQRIKGPRGCMWNGASWPYTTSIILDALGRQSRQNNHAYDREWNKFFDEYLREHFLPDQKTPYLTEFYDSITGEAVSDEPDYSHSYFLDLVIRYIAGIEPDEQGATMHPLKTKLDWFELRQVKLKNHSIDIYYQSENANHFQTQPTDYSVYVDNKPIIKAVKLTTFPIRLF